MSDDSSDSIELPSNGTIYDSDEARVEICEQPQQRGYRFRYKCEGGSHGGIQGESSNRQGKKTYPSIRIRNFSGSARIICKLVSVSPNPRTHAHELVGKQCVNGICVKDEQNLREDTVIQFQNVGVSHITKKKVVEVLVERLIEERKQEAQMTNPNNVFHLTEQQRNEIRQIATEESRTMELSKVSLCFDVWVSDPSRQSYRRLNRVISKPIFDCKAPGAAALRICRMDRSSGSARGGEEIYLLCDKVQKDDIEVRFYELKDNQPVWEDSGRFGPQDVHRQYAIVFQTPPYRDVNIEREVNVKVELRRRSDGECSEPLDFIFKPADNDEEFLCRKRRKPIFPGGIPKGFEDCFGGPGNGGPGLLPKYGRYSSTMNGVNGSSNNSGGSSEGETSSGQRRILHRGNQAPASVFHELSNSSSSSSGGNPESPESHAHSPAAIRPHHHSASSSPGYAHHAHSPPAASPPGYAHNSPPAASPPGYARNSPSIASPPGYAHHSPPAATATFPPSYAQITRSPPLQSNIVTSNFTDDMITDLVVEMEQVPLNVNAQVQISPVPQQQQQMNPSMMNTPLFVGDTPFYNMLHSGGSQIYPSSSHLSPNNLSGVHHSGPPPADYVDVPTQLRVNPTLMADGNHVDGGLCVDFDRMQLETNQPGSILDENGEKTTDAAKTLKDKQVDFTNTKAEMMMDVVSLFTERVATALHAYARTANEQHLLAVFRRLLLVPDENGDTPFHLAIINKQTAVVNRLLKLLEGNFEDALNMTNNLRQTPLHLAVLTRSVPLVEALLKKGVAVNVDYDGNTAMHLAARCGVDGALKALLSEGSTRERRLEVLNYKGKSPLHLASARGHLGCVKLLLAAKVNVGQRDGHSGRTALHHAVEQQHVEVAKLLLDKDGSLANMADFSGNTPLHLAAGKQLAKLVSLLIASGGDPHIQNGEPLDSGVEDGDSDLEADLQVDCKVADEKRGHSSFDLCRKNEQLLALMVKESNDSFPVVTSTNVDGNAVETSLSNVTRNSLALALSKVEWDRLAKCLDLDVDLLKEQPSPVKALLDQFMVLNGNLCELHERLTKLNFCEAARLLLRSNPDTATYSSLSSDVGYVSGVTSADAE